MAKPKKLNQEMIVTEAIALLQEGGLGALSLRKIAARLDVKAPSLARHVGNKNQLVTLVTGTIFLQALGTIPDGLNGSDWLRAFGHALRNKQAQTRDITALLTNAQPHDPTDKLASLIVQKKMGEAGLSGPRAQIAQSTIQAFVTGWMVFENSPRREIFAQRLPEGDSFGKALEAIIAGFALDQ